MDTTTRRPMYWHRRQMRAQSLSQWGRPRRTPRPYVHDEVTFLFTPRRPLHLGTWAEYETTRFTPVVPPTWWTPIDLRASSAT